MTSKIFDQSPTASSSLLTTMQNCWTDSRDALSYAQAQYAKLSNAAGTSRELSPADLVLLKRNPLKKHPKLELFWSGLYKVLVKTSNVIYPLELKPHQPFHPVVYAILRKPYSDWFQSSERRRRRKNPRLAPFCPSRPAYSCPSPPCTSLMTLFIRRNSSSLKSPRLFSKKNYPA